MKTSELKKAFHEKIDLVSDIDFLHALNVILSKQETVYKIPDGYLESIAMAEQDFNEGRFYTLKDFEEKYSKWLKD
jgi:hypothetical protein